MGINVLGTTLQKIVNQIHSNAIILMQLDNLTKELSVYQNKFIIVLGEMVTHLHSVEILSVKTLISLKVNQIVIRN